MDTTALMETAAKCRRLAKGTIDERAIRALEELAEQCEALLAADGDLAVTQSEPINRRR